MVRLDHYDRLRDQQILNSPARGIIVIAQRGRAPLQGSHRDGHATSAQMILEGITSVCMLALGPVGPFGGFGIPSLGVEVGFPPEFRNSRIAFTTDG